MLGDWRHENALPYHSVTAVLNQWLSMAQNDSLVNRHLGLVLELFDEAAGHLNMFIRTGDWSKLYDWEFPSMSMERFEFYSNLRQLSLRVDTLNRLLPPGRQLTFDVFGTEGRDFSRDEDFQRKSPAERDRWFVYERDSLIAGRVLQYLGQHPTAKVLMFYGNAHLIKNRFNKKDLTYEPETDAWGYYAAHYLKQRLGADSVLSVNQVEVDQDFVNGTPFADEKGRNLFVYSENIPWEKLNPKDYDAFILRNEMTVSHHPFSLIFSRRVVDASIDHLKFYAPNLPGFGAKQGTYAAISTLEFIASRRFRHPEKEWPHWADTCSTSIPSLLESEEFAASLCDDYYRNFKNVATRFRLFQLGFGPGIMQEDTVWSREFWSQQIWPNIIPKLIVLNSIGINWIGYPDEKKKAKEYLVKFTGMDFPEPEAYLRWWRKEFGKATY